MVIFNSYVKLPEGKPCPFFWGGSASWCEQFQRPSLRTSWKVNYYLNYPIQLLGTVINCGCPPRFTSNYHQSMVTKFDTVQYVSGHCETCDFVHLSLKWTVLGSQDGSEELCSSGRFLVYRNTLDVDFWMLTYCTFWIDVLARDRSKLIEYQIMWRWISIYRLSWCSLGYSGVNSINNQLQTDSLWNSAE